MTSRSVLLIALLVGLAVVAARAVIRRQAEPPIAITASEAATEHSSIIAPPPALPARWTPSVTDPLVNATQVWRLGVGYFPLDDDEELQPPVEATPDEIVFAGINASTGSFLRYTPLLKPAVWFSCNRCISSDESALEKALTDGPPELKLQALAILMKVRAPGSVESQRKALGELSDRNDRPSWNDLLSEMDRCFSAASIHAALKQQVTVGRYETDNGLSWSIQAAGIIQLKTALPQLAQLSVADNIDISLAAERSLEEFHGAEADAALKTCLLGWQYDAWIRAGRGALASEQTDVERRASPKASPPANALARAGDCCWRSATIQQPCRSCAPPYRGMRWSIERCSRKSFAWRCPNTRGWSTLCPNRCARISATWRTRRSRNSTNG